MGAPQQLEYERKVTVDYGLLIVHGREDYWHGQAGDTLLERVTGVAASSPLHLAAEESVMVLGLAGQYREDVPVTISVGRVEPPEDAAEWDMVADVDMPVVDGALWVRSGGGTEPVSVAVPNGRYRLRVSARGYESAGLEIGTEEFRLALWPGRGVGVRMVKEWAGWCNSSLG